MDNTSDLLVLYLCSSIGKPPRYEFTRKRPRQSTENADLQRGPDCPVPHEPLLWGNFLATYLPYRFVEYIRISSTSIPMFPWAGYHGSGFCPQREEPSSQTWQTLGWLLQLSWQHLRVNCGGLQARLSKLQITICIVYYVVYRLYFHPLFTFLGPWYAAL